MSISDKKFLLREMSKVVAGLGKALAPFCEVVLHDLTRPDCAIIQIENNLSGRSVGDPATELGLARLADPDFPDILANYANQFNDGRAAKSTSIGLKDSKGKYIAALCINMEISYFRSIATYLSELTKTGSIEVQETLSSRPASPDMAAKIAAFAASKNREPRALNGEERRKLLQQLQRDGELERRGALERIAAILGVSRSGLYYYLK